MDPTLEISTKMHFSPVMELKLDDAEVGKFSGYASTFGNVDLGGDIIEKGAFTKSLKRRPADKVRVLFQHNPSWPIGVPTVIEEDDKGLRVEGTLLDTTMGVDVRKMLVAKAIDGISIGYRYDPAKQSYDETRRVRTLKEVELFEFSFVTFPMNERARVRTIKSVDDIQTIRDFENFLRDVGGFSESRAKTIASCGFKPEANPREGDAGLADVVAAIRRRGEAIDNLVKG